MNYEVYFIIIICIAVLCGAGNTIFYIIRDYIKRYIRESVEDYIKTQCIIVMPPPSVNSEII